MKTEHLLPLAAVAGIGLYYATRKKSKASPDVLPDIPQHMDPEGKPHSEAYNTCWQEIYFTQRGMGISDEEAGQLAHAHCEMQGY